MTNGDNDQTEMQVIVRNDAPKNKPRSLMGYRNAAAAGVATIDEPRREEVVRSPRVSIRDKKDSSPSEVEPMLSPKEVEILPPVEEKENKDGDEQPKIRDGFSQTESIFLNQNSK